MKVKIQNENKYEGFKVIKLGYVEPKNEEGTHSYHKRDYVCPICLELGEICENCKDKYL